MPAVSRRGRTYTFRIRSGFGFSPPSHERVTAESFRHALERVPLARPAATTTRCAFSATSSVRRRTPQGRRPTSPASRPTATRSSSACATRQATCLSGCRCHAFCAVPADLPTVPHGLPYPIPSAGPYYLADRSSDVFVLKPNPNYHGPRPQRLDAHRLQGRHRARRGGSRDRARHDRLHRGAGRRARPGHGVGPHSRRALPLDREQLDRAARAQHNATAVFRRLELRRAVALRARPPPACPRARRR